MKNRAIFIEFLLRNFHWGKYFLNMIVWLDSEATGPAKDLQDVIIDSEELMVENWRHCSAVWGFWRHCCVCGVTDISPTTWRCSSKWAKFRNPKKATKSSISTLSSFESILTSGGPFMTCCFRIFLTIMFKKYFHQWKLHLRSSMMIALFFISSWLHSRSANNVNFFNFFVNQSRNASKKSWIWFKKS